jgi:DnaJ-class molecular chaperone
MSERNIRAFLAEIVKEPLQKNRNIMANAIYKLFEDETNEETDNSCHYCRGTGEGQSSDSTCPQCRGIGVERTR